jgi:hypothetical protein
MNRITLSAVGGLLVTVVSFFSNRQGWEIVALPGLIIAGLIDSVAYLFTDPQGFPLLLAWPYCAFAFYSLFFYAASWAYTGLKQERQIARKAKGEI